MEGDDEWVDELMDGSANLAFRVFSSVSSLLSCLLCLGNYIVLLCCRAAVDEKSGGVCLPLLNGTHNSGFIGEAVKKKQRKNK
jgi:hypothetical protein